MKKKLMVVCVLILSVFVLGSCADSIRAADYLNGHGFDTTKIHHLLGAEKITGQVGNMQGFFFLGGGSISGKTQPGSVLGFAIRTDENAVLVIEIPFQRIEFMIDDNHSVPTAYFRFDEHTYFKPYFVGRSSAELIDQFSLSVTLTMTRELFNQEVLPLQFYDRSTK